MLFYSFLIVNIPSVLLCLSIVPYLSPSPLVPPEGDHLSKPLTVTWFDTSVSTRCPLAAVFLKLAPSQQLS